MQNLCNLDNILSPVFNPTLTKNSFDEKNKNKVNHRAINNRGLQSKMGPSRAHIGHPLTLHELKQMQINEDANPTKEVMKSQTYHTAEQNSHAVVIYGQPQQYNNNYAGRYPLHTS